MLSRRFLPSWSHYRFDAATRAAAAVQLSDLALRLGFSFPEEGISIASLKSADALRIGHSRATCDSDFLEYPFEDRSTPECPVILRNRVIEDLLRHLHSQRWRAMRRKAMEGATGRGRDMHYDCTGLGRWASELARRGGASSHHQECREGHDGEIRTTTEIETCAGRIWMTQESILLPFQVPETVKEGFTYPRLGEIMTMPSCGDTQIDADMLDERVYKMEDEGPSTRRRTRVIIYGTGRRPMHPEGRDLPWRRLKDVRVDCARIAPDYQEIDLEQARNHYHMMCDEELGIRTDDVIPYPDIHESIKDDLP